MGTGTTFGKGTIATSGGLQGGRSLRLTEFVFYTSGGATPQLRGVTPDLTIVEPNVTQERERDLVNAIEAPPFLTMAQLASAGGPAPEVAPSGTFVSLPPGFSVTRGRSSGDGTFAMAESAAKKLAEQCSTYGDGGCRVSPLVAEAVSKKAGRK